jgi:hypothetical protein
LVGSSATDCSKEKTESIQKIYPCIMFSGWDNNNSLWSVEFAQNHVYLLITLLWQTKSVKNKTIFRMKRIIIFLSILLFSACSGQKQFYVSEIVSPHSIKLEDGTIVQLIGVSNTFNELKGIENTYIQMYDEDYNPINEVTGHEIMAYIYDMEGNCINNYAENNDNMLNSTNRDVIDQVTKESIPIVTTIDKYINNRLNTGYTPYDYLYGDDNDCSGHECSQIKVKTPDNSDVLVTVKKNNKVIRHAYIRAASSYTFEISNGVYQPFFYYGQGWNPEKIMKETSDGILKGGFVESEYFGKDDPQSLHNNILEYVLILQQNGNFSTKPSNAEEAL